MKVLKHKPAEKSTEHHQNKLFYCDKYVKCQPGTCCYIIFYQFETKNSANKRFDFFSTQGYPLIQVIESKQIFLVYSTYAY